MLNQELTYDTSEALENNNYSLDGWKFNNWNTKQDGSGINYLENVSYKNLAPSGTITLYAIWSPTTYVVSFDKQGGEGGSNSSFAAYDFELSTIIKPTRNGYTFNGYYANENGQGEKYYDENGISLIGTWMEKSPVTLYAKWVETPSMDQSKSSNFTIKNDTISVNFKNGKTADSSIDLPLEFIDSIATASQTMTYNGEVIYESDNISITSLRQNVDYYITKGSIKFSFSKEYLDTLSVGTHEFFADIKNPTSDDIYTYSISIVIEPAVEENKESNYEKVENNNEIVETIEIKKNIIQEKVNEIIINESIEAPKQSAIVEEKPQAVSTIVDEKINDNRISLLTVCIACVVCIATISVILKIRRKSYK